MIFDDQTFDVQDQIRHVLDHSGDGTVFVLNPLELDLGYGTALETGQQDATKTVRNRMPESPFEGFDMEFAEIVGERLAIAFHPTGQLQSSPLDSHRLNSKTTRCSYLFGEEVRVRNDDTDEIESVVRRYRSHD
jgi:hypothetical protein